MKALLIAIILTIFTAAPAGAFFLRADKPYIEQALQKRDAQRIIDTDSWEREFYPPLPALNTNQPTGVERWRPLVAKYFHWEDVDRALCLMHYESRGIPTAQNPDSTATGLMQIMHSVWRETFGVKHRSEWHDPELNIYAASQIQATQGWTAWAPYNRGLCKRNLEYGS